LIFILNPNSWLLPWGILCGHLHPTFRNY